MEGRVSGTMQQTGPSLCHPHILLQLPHLPVGINDYTTEEPPAAERLDTLLTWMQQAMPATCIVLLAPLPTVLRDRFADLNSSYPAMAAKHGWAGAQPTGAAWTPALPSASGGAADTGSMIYSTCGSELDPTDPAMYSDGLHPTEAGYAVLFDCVLQLLVPLLEPPQQQPAIPTGV